MRELKFRAWCNEYHRYCDFVTLDEIGRWIGWIKTSGVFLTTVDIVLEQSTGLKDKNGEEIWEGDVVEFIFNVREAEVSAVGKICFFESLAAYGMRNVKYDNQELRRLCDKENEYAGEIFCFAGYGNTDEDQTLIFTDYCFIEDDLEVLGNIHENPELLEK